MTPRISIIIPVYKRLEYLQHAIDSALSQTYPNVEVIVVDDGSPADPGPIVAGFGQRVRLVRKQNGGLASARNFGVAAASGEYIAFLDDDDFYQPDALQTLTQGLFSTSSAVWAAGKFAYVDSDGRLLPQRHACNYESGDVYERMVFNNLMGAPSVVLVKTETLKAAGGFDETFLLSEDWDMWLTLARDHPLVAVNRHVANYRLHSGQVSQKQWARHFEYHLKVLTKQQGRCRPGTAELFERGIAKLHIEYGDELYMSGDHRGARSHWREGIRCSRARTAAVRWRLAKSYLPSRVAQTIRAAAGSFRRTVVGLGNG